MANLQFGDRVKFTTPPQVISSIIDVVPLRFDALREDWVVCEQKKATHMLMTMDVVDCEHEVKHMMIEIGKCENVYLLADAIVD